MKKASFEPLLSTVTVPDKTEGIATAPPKLTSEQIGRAHV